MSIHEKFSHIDQLKEWWENADQVAPMRGDLIIEDVSDEYGPDYRIRNWPGDMKEKLSYVRVLEPKPKPAWHDAKAVIASTDYCERQVWERDTTYENRWYGSAGDGAITRDLRDVTPLVEAKVTDEMVERAAQSLEDAGWDTSDGVAALTVALTAALGLETE